MLQIHGYSIECENRGVVGTQVCPNHKHDMGKFYFIQFKNFLKQSKVLEKGNKMKETKQHLHLIYLFYPPYLDLVPQVGGSVELLVPGSLCKAFDI